MELTDNKEQFLAKAKQSLGEIYDLLLKAPDLTFADLPQEKTALMVVDVVNGFIKFGAMADASMSSIVSPIVRMVTTAQEMGMAQVAFVDSHENDAVEFAAFPIHCLKNEPESALVDELKSLTIETVIAKNSTNGFFAPEFTQWLVEHQDYNHFILVGDCTDICVMQLALALKTYFNQQNRFVRVMIAMEAVHTFNGGEHDQEVMNVLALYLMRSSGIEIFRQIK